MPKDTSFPQYSHFAICEHLLVNLERRYIITIVIKMQVFFTIFYLEQIFAYFYLLLILNIEFSIIVGNYVRRLSDGS